MPANHFFPISVAYRSGWCDLLRVKCLLRSKSILQDCHRWDQMKERWDVPCCIARTNRTLNSVIAVQDMVVNPAILEYTSFLLLFAQGQVLIPALLDSCTLSYNELKMQPLLLTHKRCCARRIQYFLAYSVPQNIEGKKIFPCSSSSSGAEPSPFLLPVDRVQTLRLLSATKQQNLYFLRITYVPISSSWLGFFEGGRCVAGKKIWYEVLSAELKKKHFCCKGAGCHFFLTSF